MNETTPRPDFMDKVSSRVRVYTATVVIEGSHHHPPGVRLSDLLRNQATTEKYMLLTSAIITATDGTETRTDYVLINTAHASVILPLEETGEDPHRSPLETPLPEVPAGAPPMPSRDRQGFGLNT
jgi:hypothetical protein